MCKCTQTDTVHAHETSRHDRRLECKIIARLSPLAGNDLAEPADISVRKALMAEQVFLLLSLPAVALSTPSPPPCVGGRDPQGSPTPRPERLRRAAAVQAVGVDAPGHGGLCFGRWKEPMHPGAPVRALRHEARGGRQREVPCRLHQWLAGLCHGEEVQAVQEAGQDLPRAHAKNVRVAVLQLPHILQAE